MWFMIAVQNSQCGKRKHALLVEACGLYQILRNHGYGEGIIKAANVKIEEQVSVLPFTDSVSVREQNSNEEVKIEFN